VGRERHLRLLALEAVDADAAALEAVLRRSGHPHLGAARYGDVLMVLSIDDAAAPPLAQRLVSALERQRCAVRAALSPRLPSSSRTERARDQVLACLAVARPGSVALVEEQRAELVLERLRAPLSEAAALVDDPLAVLNAAACRDVDFKGSLLAWLEAHGDIAAAALALGVHANTLRYRLRRALELLGTDLSDPSERLEVHLRLRLLDRARPDARETR
jgi:sugar diacid utilization regulator